MRPFTFGVIIVMACSGPGPGSALPDASLSLPDASSSTPDAAVAPGPDAGSRWTELQACQLRAEAICGLFERCNMPWDADCVESWRASCERRRPVLERSADAGRVAYDVAAYGACFDAAADAGCVRAVDHLNGCVDERGMVGAVGYGGACTFDGDCRDGYCWLDACPGICVPYVGHGASCAARRCAPGTTCRTVSDGGSTCRVTGHEGDPCTQLDDCASWLTCARGACRSRVGIGERCRGAHNCPGAEACAWDGRSSTNPVYVCTDAGTVGEPCAPSSPSVNELCERGLWCSLFLRTCQRPLPEGGRMCSVNTGGCEPGLWCDQQTCVAPRGVDAGCEVMQPESCQAGLHCNGLVCMPPVGEGKACRDDFGCLPGMYCDANVCKALLTDGAACTASSRCAGFCIDGRCTSACAPP